MTSIYGAGISQQYQNIAPLKVRLIIHHQCPGIELVSSDYACECAICYLSPDPRVIVGSTTQAGFIIVHLTQSEPIGILMYELKNMKCSNKNAVFREDDPICTWIYIMWKISNSKEFRVASRLIEHDKGLIWTEDKLMKLAKRHTLFDIQHGPVELTHLIYNNTALTKRLNVTREAEYCKIEMTISEGSIKDDTLRPPYINVDKLQSTIRINIYNQHLDFKLTNLESSSTGIIWNKYPDREVDAGSMMSAFSKPYLTAFEGSLMYQLQRKHVKSDDQPNSTNTLLFIALKSEGYNEFLARVCLIKCDKQIKWNQYKLEEYRQSYHSQLSTYTGPIKDAWLLNDGTVLVTEMELNFIQRYDILNIIISKGVKDDHIKRPVWIGPESFNKEALHINICNLYPSLELTSPVYFSNGTVRHVSPIQQTYIGTVSAGFGIGSNQKAFKGALLYKLWRKHATRADNHLNDSIALIENTAENVYLLVVWNDVYNHKFCVCLIEFTNDFVWDEDKLWALYSEYNYQFHTDYKSKEDTWLIHGNAVIKTRLGVTYGSGYKLDIFISEETGKYIMRSPMKINSKSLPIRPSFKLNIYNRCLNVGLASPVCITSDELECHRVPDYEACTGGTMRSCFVIKSDDESYGVLMYKLQRKRTHKSAEISKDTSSIAQILVVWRISESKELYTNVLLVEHDNSLIWNEDKLNKLYHKNHDWLKEYTDTTSDTWLVDNDIVLKTTFSVKDLKGNPELNISISEENDDYTIRPLCVDLESLTLQSPVLLNIHNQCKDINLTSPVYFIHGGRWPIAPDQEIVVNAVMQNLIKFDAEQDLLEGALVYRIQRRHVESAQDESKHIWLLIAWNGGYVNGSDVCALLIEHNKRLGEDRLKKLYQKRWPLLKERANATGGSWTLNDTTKLATTIKVTNRGYRWDIFISEERK